MTLYNDNYRGWAAPLIDAIDASMRTRARTIVCIDGGSASGKSTLANYIGSSYDAPVIAMDDFFLRPMQRTEERTREVGGNFDYERFNAEVVRKLRDGGAFSYRAFDCLHLKLGNTVEVPDSRLIVIEGVYSMSERAALSPDVSAFVEISKGEQERRIFIRESAIKAERFFNEWIPKEEAYFAAQDVKRRCGVVLRGA